MIRFTTLALPLALLAGCAPENVARSSCRSEMLSSVDRWTCTVGGARIARASSIEFDTESRNSIAKVTIAMKVARGTLRVRYDDLDGPKQLLVTPEAPMSLEMQTRLHRERRSFTLSFEPVGGPAEGLTGTVDYHTPRS